MSGLISSGGKEVSDLDGSSNGNQEKGSGRKSARISKAEQEQEKIESQLQQLLEVGRTLDKLVPGGDGTMITVRDREMKSLLKFRDKSGALSAFVPNDAQRHLAGLWGRKNIVLKARQLGVTTYVAARFFIETITRPGTLTVMVAHDQQSAEDIFRS